MPNVKLDRQILAKFLDNNHKAIVAFERVLEYVDSIGPDALLELLSIVSSIKRVNTTEINARLADLETGPARRGGGDTRTDGRIAELETMARPSVNLAGIYARLDALEANQKRITNMAPILARLETIEKFIGV